MANATRKVLAGYGADARELAMIAYGGNGAVHAWAIAAELGIERVLVPKTAPAFSALGVLVADYVVDLMRSYVVPLSQVDLQRLRDLMRDVSDEATKEMAPAGLGPRRSASPSSSSRWPTPVRTSTCRVPAPEGTDLTDATLLDLAERFHDQHERDRGFAFRNQQPIVRGVRLTARGSTPKPDHLGEPGDITDIEKASKGSRPVYFGVEFVDTPVYDGKLLGVGATVVGPALIEEPFTVVVVPPGTECRLADHLSYELVPTS